MKLLTALAVALFTTVVQAQEVVTQDANLKT